MGDVAIEIQGLGKRYKIGQRAGYHRLTEALAGAMAAPFQKRKSTDDKGHIWALKDVTFAVKKGEVIGIIGRNGAGKSTLLKIISRITEMTEGYVDIYGRIGSLLEVGTGFHPELTGRENIYLNGAIIGMKRLEIRRKFDEIVEFAEVARFLDTPVKHYSSGMSMRLAFAVAAHLETEILIMDEVLAIGDAAFQKKCLGKMGEVAKEGRTILIVSHNMGMVGAVCSRAIFLNAGCKQGDGTVREIIPKYVETMTESRGEAVWEDPGTAPGTERVRLRAARIICDEQVTPEVLIDREIIVEMEYWILKANLQITSGIHLYDRTGVVVLSSFNGHSANLGHDKWYGRPAPEGLYRVRCTIPANFLNEGRYAITAIVAIDGNNCQVLLEEAVSFTVHDTGKMRKEYSGEWIGVVRPKLAWETDRVDESGPESLKKGYGNRVNVL